MDARNPLLFHCEDLVGIHTYILPIYLFIYLRLILKEKYVKEVNTEKENLLLLNKADLLTDHQRLYVPCLSIATCH